MIKHKPRVISSIQSWKRLRKSFSCSLGFVPTLGALHEGHASLLKKARAENELCVLSIFVNPTQFNDPNDYRLYPKMVAEDFWLANKLKVDYIFTPNPQDIYADGFQYNVRENKVSQILEGKYRPQHFEGVLTVVLKLFSLVKPERAYFGEKDYQQLYLIKEMVKAFFMDIEIIACPTIRHPNGLAMSSRNARLSQNAFSKSALFAQHLSSNKNESEIKMTLETLGFQVDYIEKWNQRLFGAVTLENVRLIDNVPI